MNIDPREWDLQEQALREDAAYREVARALRRSPGEPPADFAASVAGSVAAIAPGAHTPAAQAHAAQTITRSSAARGPASAATDGRFERWVLRAGAAVLGVAFVYAIARYGDAAREGFGAIEALLGGSTALNWVAAAGACMALSWAFTQGEPRFGRSRR